MHVDEDAGHMPMQTALDELSHLVGLQMTCMSNAAHQFKKQQAMPLSGYTTCLQVLSRNSSHGTSFFHLVESCIVTMLCKAKCGCSGHTSKHGGSHSNDVRLQLAHGGPDISVQGVGMAEGAVCIQQQIQVLLASHVQGS